MSEVVDITDRLPRRETARNRVLSEGVWTRRCLAEFTARWRGLHVPLIACAWDHHVRDWRKDYPLCAPDNVPWSTLWTTFLIRHPEARRGNEPEGAA